ncbi:MAG: hypothetical protein ACPW61_03555 [Methyloligella sp. ZOD6]
MADLKLRDAPSIIAVAGALSVVITVAHEAGFFFSIDPTLMSLFSLEDILRSSLKFLPPTLIGVILGGYLVIFIPKAAKFFDQREAGTRFTIWLLTIFTILNLLFLSHWARGLLWLTSFNAGAVSGLIASRLGNSKTSLAVGAGTLVVLFATLSGLSEGQTARSSEIFSYELRLKSGKNLNVNLLRTTSEVFVVRHNKSEIWVVPRSEVALLKRKNVNEPEPLISLGSAWSYIVARWREKTGLTLE